MCVARFDRSRRPKLFAGEIQGTADPSLHGAEGLPELGCHFSLRITLEIGQVGQVDNPTLIDIQSLPPPVERPRP